MSAQVVAALRRRADELEAETEPPAQLHGPVSGFSKWLAAEFRALAAECEAGS